MTAGRFVGQLHQRIRVLALVIAAVLVAGAFLAVSRQPAPTARAPHFLGMRQLQLDAASGKARLFLRMAPVTAAKPGAAHSTDLPLSSVVWGVSNNTPVGAGSNGAGAGKVTFNPFTITRKVDQASPALFQAAASGVHFQSATIFVLPPAGTAATTEAIEYQLTFPVVSSALESSSPNGSIETYGLAYNGLTEKYIRGGKATNIAYKIS
jgi:type VI protein secretion system component Hcp